MGQKNCKPEHLLILKEKFNLNESDYHNLDVKKLEKLLILSKQQSSTSLTSSSSSPSPSSKCSSKYDHHESVVSHDSGCGHSTTSSESTTADKRFSTVSSSNSNIKSNRQLNLEEPKKSTKNNKNENQISKSNEMKSLSTSSLTSSSSLSQSLSSLSRISSLSSLSQTNFKQKLKNDIEFRSKAEALCDQLNQILNLSTSLLTDELLAVQKKKEEAEEDFKKTKKQRSRSIGRIIMSTATKSEAALFNSSKKTTGLDRFVPEVKKKLLINAKDDKIIKNNLKRNKSLFSTPKLSLSLQSCETHSSTQSSFNIQQPLSVNKRSSFFFKNKKSLNSNYEEQRQRIQQECNRNVIRNYLLTTEIETNQSSPQKQSKNNNDPPKTLNVPTKSRRRFQFPMLKRDLNQNKVQSLDATNKNTKQEEITNLIAAKLLSENIELSRPPFSDKVIQFLLLFLLLI
jgi:hypothetical protein